MYRQTDLICSDLELIAIQNDPKLPLNDKLVYLEGDDHLKSRLAALGQVTPNFFPNRKVYNFFGKEETQNAVLGYKRSIDQLTRIHEDDRLHMTRMYLATQVEDVVHQPFQMVRIPRMDQRIDRTKLKNERRLRLLKSMATWQVNDQLAREEVVFNQVQPNPKYKPVMPENWFRKMGNDDTRSFEDYQKILNLSPAYFAEVSLDYLS